MKTRAALLVVVIAGAAFALASPGHAKGASRATITGPGLDKPVEVEAGLDTALTRLANHTGIYPSIFETRPNPLLDRRPRGRLGPRYNIAWVLDAPGRKANVVNQDVYPFARPDPLTYVKPGQPTYGSGSAVGGWYVAGPLLKPFLVASGVLDRGPERPDETTSDETTPDQSTPAADEDDAVAVSNRVRTEPDSGSGWPIAITVAVVVGVLGAIGAVLQRRRPRAVRA